ncbi:hypothetical protein T4D_5579 [Trichinella pseudospiralis]|uniref:Uncharacterized protein n=1 Tax=Trichinella pseudospiralis TaxID=6337 RepID=A0A0V1F2Y4_TRIPS|nr:hypothetical protein T4D_5579 [Trichinella pseudospiralis]
MDCKKRKQSDYGDFANGMNAKMMIPKTEYSKFKHISKTDSV